MTEILDALKSIVQGLEIQTESGQAKWLTGNQLAKLDEKYSWKKDDKEKLEVTLYYQLDRDTMIEYHCYIQHDHVVNSSYLSIENKGLQSDRVVIGSKNLPELQGLEDVLYSKYIEPILKSYSKGYADDVHVLSKIVNKCGVEAARDYKINSVLNEKDKEKEEKGFFGKLFNK